MLFQTQGLVKLREDRDGASVRTFDGRATTARTARHNILAANGVSSLVVRQLSDAERVTVVRVKHTDRDRGFRPTTTEIRDWRLGIGAITGANRAAGSQIRGATSKAIGYLTATARNGDAFLLYVQDIGAAAFVSGETLSIGPTAAASTCSTISAPFRAVPEKPMDLQLVGITRRSQAQRIARAELTGAVRRSLFASWGIWWGDADLEPCDVVALSVDVPAYAGKLWTVLEVGYGMDGKGRISVREYDEDAFALVDGIPEKIAFAPGGAIPTGLRDTGSSSGAAPSSGGGTPTASQSGSTGGATSGFGILPGKG